MAVLSAGCASKPLASFSGSRPAFDPLKYFAGRTHSWGVFETPSGKPTQILRTYTEGRLKADGLHFEQDLVFEKGRKAHRSWVIRRVDEHHYTATGTGIVGTARGEARGNIFHIDFTIDALPGNPLAHLRMRQWLYLQEDGVTVINRATLSKGGVVVAMVTEQFRKDR
jgi:hypothetical protein